MQTTISPFIGPPDSNCKYETIRFLGKGSYGVALEVKKRGTDAKYAAKIVELRGMADSVKMRAYGEISCLKSIKHFGCISFVDLYQSKEVLVLVVELGDAGSLKYQIKKYREEGMSFNEETVITVALQLIMALHYMHGKKILHRDIKSDNVLLTTTGLTKIGDFGLSNMYDSISGDVGSTFCGTAEYIAPEIWKLQRYGKAADIWALGVVLYEIITGGALPFTGRNAEDLEANIVTNSPPPILAPWNQELIDTVFLMLSKAPSERPSTRDLLLHPIFWNALQELPARLDRSSTLSPELRASIVATIKEVTEDLFREPQEPVATMRKNTFEGHVEKRKGDRYETRYLTAKNGNLYISMNKETPLSTRGCAPLDSIQRVQLVEEDGEKGFILQFERKDIEWFRTPDALQWVEFLQGMQERTF